MFTINVKKSHFLLALCSIFCEIPENEDRAYLKDSNVATTLLLRNIMGCYDPTTRSKRKQKQRNNSINTWIYAADKGIIIKNYLFSIEYAFCACSFSGAVGIAWFYFHRPSTIISSSNSIDFRKKVNRYWSKRSTIEQRQKTVADLLIPARYTLFKGE